MADDKNAGWFRHRRSGQVFEAEGSQYREALKNRDLEEIDAPGEKSAESPSSRLVGLRERLTAAGGTWEASDTEDDLNRKLEARAVELRAQMDQLNLRYQVNWKPETLAAKVAEEVAARTKVTTPATPPES